MYPSSPMSLLVLLIYARVDWFLFIPMGPIAIENSTTRIYGKGQRIQMNHDEHIGVKNSNPETIPTCSSIDKPFLVPKQNIITGTRPRFKMRTEMRAT